MNQTGMKVSEARLMEIETRLDRIQNESRKALGEVRRIMGYHRPSRQKTIISYLDRPEWCKHQKDLRGDPP